MISEVLKSIEGVEIFPLIGLFLFMAGFVVILILTWRMKPGDVDYLSRLPLDSDHSVHSDDRSDMVGRTEK